MLCAIYKSNRKEQTYLFVGKRDDFSSVPEPLMQSFGQPQLAMIIELKAETKLAISNPQKVMEALQGQGYYLQLPPPQENLLAQYKQQQEPLND
ncbi:YcgL domain-containing protein [Lacimicrobium alkaliphilum]|uniref:YcgL domain-containing protein GCM10011357_18950 n=1 Tax=Lacimicrobium alkaliphilum TaxID=1526571 RepID=A0ABQ1RDR8_9ALTE|nr:YcgL domain-containing protein [Lacimicrobium alkaliphilum]GGD63813.1 YcgL domain-containing protein [Lacimicrobium alkaliphilum]